MPNETLEKLEIKDVFTNAFWSQNIQCPKCDWTGGVYELRAAEAKTRGTNIYRLNCPRCNKLVVDLSLSAWKK